MVCIGWGCWKHHLSYLMMGNTIGHVTIICLQFPMFTRQSPAHQGQSTSVWLRYAASIGGISFFMRFFTNFLLTLRHIHKYSKRNLMFFSCLKIPLSINLLVSFKIQMSNVLFCFSFFHKFMTIILIKNIFICNPLNLR